MTEQIALFIDFENIAIWAEQEYFDLELTVLMEFLRSRGAVVIKRAYGDWTRFPSYRNDMLNLSIDLIQLYSVRDGKNRGDIRLTIDAFEIAITREQINTFVIVSGDSDFGPLVSKLREYGRYVLGIGPRGITHPLLVSSCDEFVYLQTIMGEEPGTVEDIQLEQDGARKLLQKALAVYGQRGDLPVLAGRLKQTMLSMDSTFNEIKLGYSQFKDFLEDNDDLARVYFKDLQVYTAPADFSPGPTSGGTAPVSGSPAAEPSTPKTTQAGRSPTRTKKNQAGAKNGALLRQYQNIFQRMLATDVQTRRDVLRDIYLELRQQPGGWTPDALLGELQKRYGGQGLQRSRSTLLKIWQIGFRQYVYHYLGPISFDTAVKLAEDITSEEIFIRKVETGFIYAVFQAGYPIDLSQLAAALVNDAEQQPYILGLLSDLENRSLLIRVGKEYRLPGKDIIPFHDDIHLQVLIHDIEAAQAPEKLPRDAATAFNFAEKGKKLRAQDFSASAQNYLTASYLQLEAIKKREPEATLDDFRWYMVSYASVKAGELSQSQHLYNAARVYYLAFFAMVVEDDPLWDRVRGLINPMLYYYWLNIGRELGIPLKQTSSPVSVAVQAALHSDPLCRQKWLDLTQQLAQVNPNLLTRFAHQIRLSQRDDPETAQVADQIQTIVESHKLKLENAR